MLKQVKSCLFLIRIMRKALLEENLADYKSDLDNTLLFRESVEKNENLFKNNADDSKFYYRYEQYKNGVLLTAQEIDNSILSSSLSKEEKKIIWRL